MKGQRERETDRQRERQRETDREREREREVLPRLQQLRLAWQTDHLYRMNINNTDQPEGFILFPCRMGLEHSNYSINTPYPPDGFRW